MYWLIGFNLMYPLATLGSIEGYLRSGLFPPDRAGSPSVSRR
jgi:hypothetical protein